MKKIIIGILLSLFVLTMFNSCKGKKDCPAYGQNQSEQFDKNA